MKKTTLTVLFCGFMALIITGCGTSKGNISEYVTKDVESHIYTKKEINNAIKVTTEYFKENFDGCTLNEIYYSGDEYSQGYQDWANRNNADEVIVLLSTFKTGKKGGDGSLNPNDTYSNWNWILVRTDKGKWVHVDHGY